LYGILLTQDDGAILGPISKLLGFLMEGIFNLLDLIGIPNIGLSIIIFTIAIYLLLMPLTIKQQKFSKLSAKMNPELQAIQAKYKNKKDNESMMAMNQETQAVYAKYGVSPSGSCVQLLIQMPILFSLYRVIYAMPAYVGKIKDSFYPLVEKLKDESGAVEFVQGLSNSAMYANQFTNEAFTNGNVEYVENTLIDCLNRASTAEWASLADKFPTLSNDINRTLTQLNEYNNFLGLNMANSPSFTMKDAFATGSYLLVIGALLIPLLSALTQWINTKLMPQASNNGKSGNETADAMAQSMKTMNVMMPIMSAFFCFTLPAGMGLYWIAGSVVRSIQQIAINKYFDRMDMDEMIKKNEEKYKEKMEKAGVMASGLNNYASMNTKNISSKASMTQSEKEEALKKANEYYSKNAKPGSIAAKANMVKEYNEKNNK
jgi:YidC/Oxa1 family membrane protein insertase